MTNGVANITGLALDKIPYTRGGSIVGRKFIKQGINYSTDKLKICFIRRMMKTRKNTTISKS